MEHTGLSLGGGKEGKGGKGKGRWTQVGSACGLLHRSFCLAGSSKQNSVPELHLCIRRKRYMLDDLALLQQRQWKHELNCKTTPSRAGQGRAGQDRGGQI